MDGQRRLRNMRSRLSRSGRAAALIAQTGLFDESYYLLNGADLAQAGVDPLLHFCRHGWKEGRRPNPYFDPVWYRTRYIVGLPEQNPLEHFIREGESKGSRPIPFFDPSWYRKRYELPCSTSPLAHYLAHRRTQRFSPTAHFDLLFYLERNRSEIGVNRDPFMHHVRQGAVGRDLDPSQTFDAARYRREVMAIDRRVWTGLASHEMRVPLIHFLHGVRLPTEP